MCLAIPGKLLNIFDEGGLMMGIIDINGSRTKACLAYVPEINVGDFAIIHAGFALKIVNEEEAAESLKLWQELLDSGAFQCGEASPTPELR